MVSIITESGWLLRRAMAVVIASAILSSPASQAAEPPLSPDPRIDQLEREVDDLRLKLQVLSEDRAGSHSGMTPLEPINIPRIDDESADSSAIAPAGFWDGLPQPTMPCPVCPPIVTNSPFPTVKLGGFFQADAVFFEQAQSNREAVVDGRPLGDLQDGLDFRRARLSASGDVWDNTGYFLEMDFANPGRPSFMDIYVELKKLPGLGNVRIGQWRQPFGMDSMTSVKELTFIERGLPFAFVPFRQIGIGLQNTTDDEAVTWALSAFRYPTDVYGAVVGNSGGYGFAGRATAIAYEGDQDEIVHIGAAYSFADPANNRLRYFSPPEVLVFENVSALTASGIVPFTQPFVDTGFLSTDTYSLVGLELAAEYGSFLFQSEYMWNHVNLSSGDSALLQTGSAQASYVLTGEVRPYNRKSAVFGRVKPDEPFRPGRGWGAWEVAARWSFMDLNDGPVTGNRLHNLTAGLNWYLNQSTKIQFNYIHAMLDSAPADSTADVFAIRTQLDF